MKNIKGIVKRGYITRMLSETEWEEELVPIPHGFQLVDGDAIPYYIKNDDGKFSEYYAHFAPEGKTVYLPIDFYSPEMFE
jgi:hypothetical protein